MSDIKRSDTKKRTRIASAKKRSKSTFQSKQSSETFSSVNSTPSAIALKDKKCGPNSLVILNELNFKYEIHFCGKQPTNFFMQEKLMEKFFQHNPEFLCIDILCDAPELDQFLVLFIAIDSNGHCEIVSVGLVKSGNKKGFIWLYEMFQKHNPGWLNIEVILTDENCNQEILKAAFPEKYISVSFFHWMEALKKDLSSLHNLVVPQDVNTALQIFEKMMSELSQSGYVNLLKQMKKLNVHVFNMFKGKWHMNRNIWTSGLHTETKIFMKQINMYLLNIRRKLKPLARSQETLDNLIRSLHSTIYKFRKEWFQQITKILHSPAASYLNTPVMQKYASFVTPFASELIYEQLKKSGFVNNVQKVDRQSYYKVDESLVTSYSCCCNFHQFMKLPCYHIFSVRAHLLLSQFVQSVRPSWIFENYSDTFFTLYSAHILESETLRSAELRRRYEEFVRTSHQLWGQIFISPEQVSQERLEIYKNILKAWRSNFQVAIIRSEKQNEPFPGSSEILETLTTDTFKELYGISIEDITNLENEFMDVALSPDDDIALL